MTAPPRRVAITLTLAAALAVALAGAVGVAMGQRSRPAPAPLPAITFAPAGVGALAPGRVEDRPFESATLGWPMAITVYLPPGYDSAPDSRYPALYLLHGGSGLRSEWIDYGLLATADRLMRERAIAPFIIVLPQGDQEYWVDHISDPAVGANGEKWGTYTARDVVSEIDRGYRTLARADARAIGGLSMGGHAAMQLALSFPGVWSIVGAHSPSLRPYGDAPTYLGEGSDFAARDPLLLIRAKPDLARAYTWWIDSGDADPWRAEAGTIDAELTALGIAHEWHSYSGDHSLEYWSAHIEDYLRYYAAALCRRPGACRS